MQETPNKSPGYGETIAEIGQQLNKRKGLLFKRTIFISWPAILLAGAIPVIQELLKNGTISKDSPYIFPLVIGLFIWVIFSLVYYATLNYIFTTEKRIWIDSFFDKRTLEPKESWRIARRLFFPSVIISLNVFLRYILPAIIVYSFILYLGITSAASFVSLFKSENSVGVMMFAVMVSVVVLVFYFELLRVKLRFLPFIFLDYYGAPDFTYSNLFKKMKEINKVRKTALKSFIYDSGEASMRAVVNSIANQLQGTIGSVGSLGVAGKVVGAMVGVTVKETGKQTLSYANIVAHYLLFRYASLQVAPTTAEVVNENIYNLSK
jgi:hypothetical protein